MARKSSKSPGKLRIRMVRSSIGCTEKQKAVLRSLGLRRIQQEVVHVANPAIQGMIQKIPHMLAVREES